MIGLGTGLGTALATPSGYESATLAGIAAVEAGGGSLTDAEKDACDAFIRGLKAQGIWQKCAALYLLVGGVADAHSVNWKLPGTYDITWSNSPTHDGNGVTGEDVAGAYGSTAITLSTECPQDNAHLSVYCKTSAATNTLIGGSEIATAAGMVLSCGASLVSGRANDSTNTDSAGDTAAFYLLSRTASNARFIQRNATQVTSTTASVASVPYELILLASNEDGVPANFTNANLAFVSVGTGITTAQGLALNTLVQALQTAFGRNV